VPKAKNLRWKSLLVYFLILIPLTVFFYFYKRDRFVYDKVVQVVDGDTFFIQNRQPIRLYGINAPELGNCYSEAAKAELTKLVLGKEVKLTGLRADHYGRIVADAYLKDGTYVNLHLVKDGFAVYVRAYDDNIIQMKEAGSIARQNKIGIFNPSCYQREPENPKCKIKGTLDEKSPDRKYYLKPSCAYYNSVVVEKYLGEQWFCTEKDAVQAGFSKSPNCK